ncbi:a0ec38dc-444c-455d-994a-9892e341f82f [Sclerotinia trifoliorum]|uniref:A0ec38dc-444c-455d-994a-9892e341f82f n=1 Tax=Sclerotinia trifoliorum TaxID=28548 RepID=A0A8H2W3G8_9HELO|nr:a0ec38dc-444c-455d-994a-9892e341f82f [Sclerotinia trifoliorum]
MYDSCCMNGCLQRPQCLATYIFDIDMVSLTPFILSSSFSCSRSGSKTRSKIKSKLLAGKTSYTTYCAHNTSRERLLIPSDHSLAEPVQDFQEPRRSSPSQHWYFPNHSKRTKDEAGSSKNEFAGYYLLAVASRPAQSMERRPTEKRDSPSTASNSSPSTNGNVNNIFRETVDSTAIDTQGERRRSYGIGGAGNIRKPSEMIYTPRERRRSSVFNSPSVSPSTSSGTKRGTFLSWIGIGSGKKDEEQCAIRGIFVLE